MNPEEPQESQEPDFTPFGQYSPREASKLLERFEKAGIAFQAEPMNAGRPGGRGPTTTILIRVDPARSSEANRIHCDLFGDGLPNYDSSFFREGHNG